LCVEEISEGRKRKIYHSLAGESSWQLNTAIFRSKALQLATSGQPPSCAAACLQRKPGLKANGSLRYGSSSRQYSLSLYQATASRKYWLGWLPYQTASSFYAAALAAGWPKAGSSSI
jgi:hypothetical protein